MNTTILIDMDDTMTKLLPAWIFYLNNKYHTSVIPNDITNWDILKFFPGLTKEQVFEPLYNNSFWRTVQPKQDAIEYIKKLQDDGYNIFVCTASFYQSLQAKMDDLLFKYFDYLNWNNVIITPYKQMIKADFLIDDRPENLLGGSYQGILIDAPHNQQFDNNKALIPRVKGWSEAYRFIKKWGKCFKHDNYIYYRLREM